jgi:hypothetical protein
MDHDFDRPVGDLDHIPYPTEEARKFHPPDIRTGDASGPTSQRNVFGLSFADPAMEYTEYELERISELDASWGSSGDPISGTGIEETQKLRFLQGSEWDTVKASKAIHDYVHWKSDRPVITMHAPDKNNLHNFLYWFGKDKCHRPILIVHGQRLLRRKQSTHSVSQIAAELVQVMDFFVSKLSIPGHVEQVTVIVDLQGCDAWESPVELARQCAMTLASYFRARLSKVFLLNTPLLFYTIWRMVKYFVPARTVAKVNILRSDYMPVLLEHIHADMIDPVLVPQYIDDSSGSNKMLRVSSAVDIAGGFADTMDQ